MSLPLLPCPCCRGWHKSLASGQHVHDRSQGAQASPQAAAPGARPGRGPRAQPGSTISY